MAGRSGGGRRGTRGDAPRAPTDPTARRRVRDASASAPAGGAAWIVPALVGLLALRLAAALLPGRWLWGLDLGRDGSPVGFGLAVGVTLAACLPPVSRGLVRLLPRGPRGTAALALAGALALAAFVHRHPDGARFTGDASLRHGGFATVEHPEELAQQAMPGDLLLHHALPRAVSRRTPWTAEQADQAQGVLLAFLTALAGWRLARALGASGAPALAAAAIASCTAALALDGGYAKATVELAFLTTVLAVGAVRLATDGRGLGTVGTALAAGLLLHRSALALVPVWLVGAVLAVRDGRAREPRTLAGLALPLAALVATGPRLWRVATGFDASHHLPPGGAAGLLASTFAPSHLADVANLACLLVPLAPVLPWLLAVRPRFRPREALIAAALALPPVALVFVVRPQQGLVRDWDVFAFAGSALAAVAAWRVARAFEARPAAHALALPLALAAAWPALQWAALAGDPPRLFARVESIYTGPPVREREERAQGLAWLGMARYARGETAAARRLFELSSAVSPHPRMLVQWGILAQLADRPEEALGYFRRSAAINPGLAPAWQGIAETGAVLGDAAAVREAVAHLERLEPDHAALPAARAWLGSGDPR